MRIALFGGTFDPPHRGHITIARAAVDRFQLDSVLFVPAAQQPLKRAHTVAPYADRMAMVTLACAADPHFIPSGLDAPHPDGTPNYTFQTLEALRRLEPSAELFNLAGVDSFRTLGHWREPRRLLELAEWIVVSRPGLNLFGPDGTIVAPDSLPLSTHERTRIHPLDSVHESISATALRERLEAGYSCEHLLPPGVATYIAEHSLYRRASPEPVTPQ